MWTKLRSPLLGWLLAGAAALAASGAEPPAAAKAPASSWPWAKAVADITRIAEEVDGRVGVYLRCLDTGESFSLRGDESFPAASTIKVPLLFELYRQSQSSVPGLARLSDSYVLDSKDLVEDSPILGQLRPGTALTNRDLALFTVAVSDNAATNILIQRVGMDRVNAAMEGLGFKGLRLRRKMMDLEAARRGAENLATPRELAELMALLHLGKALSPESRSDLLGLLRTPKDSYLTRLLPEDLAVANKPGSLPGVRNDVGLVLLKGRPFVIAVMVSHLRDERRGEAAIARIALRAAAALDVAAAVSPEGRILAPLQVK